MVNFSVLSEADKTLVHDESLKILEQVGIRLESPKTLAMLKEKGCDVDEASSVVKFPSALVEKALASCPRKFILGAPDPKNDLFLGEGNTYIATDGQSCFAFDTEKGERRDSVMTDLMDAAKIVSKLDYIQLFWPIVSAGDLPEEIRTVSEFARGINVVGKHFQTDCFSEAQAAYYIKVLEAMCGSREKAIERKLLSLVCCPVSPLVYDAEMTEGCLALTELEVPILILPMPISGTTGPMSLLGTVIANNTEVLAGVTIFQLKKPGTPILYGSAPGILDMATTLFCTGSPEGALQNAASCEMAKRYGLPVLISTNCSEAKEPDVQAGREKAATLTACAMTRPDILCGVGLVDAANLYYPEMLVLDEDSVGYALRIVGGIRGGAEHALTDAVLAVGPGGDFLSQKSTRAYLRNGEHYRPAMTVRQSFETWAASPDGDIRAKARKKVAEILAGPDINHLSDDVRAKLDKILSDVEK